MPCDKCGRLSTEESWHCDGVHVHRTASEMSKIMEMGVEESKKSREDLQAEALASLDRISTPDELPGDRMVVKNAIHALVTTSSVKLRKNPLYGKKLETDSMYGEFRGGGVEVTKDGETKVLPGVQRDYVSSYPAMMTRIHMDFEKAQKTLCVNCDHPLGYHDAYVGCLEAGCCCKTLFMEG